MKSIFRETARQIIADDRTARRYGYSQNTVGKITSALAMAYKEGCDHTQSKQAAKDEGHETFIRWEDIPPTSRNVLFSIEFSLKYADDAKADLLVLVPTDTPTKRWALLSEATKANPRLFSQKGIGPLVRLGILEASDERGDKLRITDIGLGTVQEFRRRWDKNDPTLPIMSLRG